MGTKINSNYSDLLTFTRASKGHALRPVSYGTELVTNGTFDSDASGWGTQDSNISVASVDGEAKVTASSASSYIFDSFPTKVGAIYKITADGRLGSNVTALNFNIRNNSHTGTYLTASPQLTSDGTLEFVFVAEAATTAIRLVMFKSTNPAVAYWDNVSVKEVTFDQPDGTLMLFEHPNNVPRVEWDADRNRLGLLVEESRTNYISYSDFSSNWSTNLSGTITANQAEGLDKTQSMAVLTCAGTTSGIYGTTGNQTNAGASGASYTLTVVLKHKTGNNQLRVRLEGSGVNNAGIVVNVEDGSFVSNSGAAPDSYSIEDFKNGFYKVSITVTTNAAGSVVPVFYGNQSGSSEFYIGMAQLEAGSFPTSYIKTTGSTATRSADVASIPVADFGFNADAGSLLVSFDTKGSNGSTYPRPAEINDGTGSNRIAFWLSPSNNVGFNVNDGGVNQGTLYNGGAQSVDTAIKSAGAYKLNDLAHSTNGTTAGTDTSATIPAVTTLRIGSQTSGQELNGHIKKLTYYPRRLTNAQLVELTS